MKCFLHYHLHHRLQHVIHVMNYIPPFSQFACFGQFGNVSFEEVVLQSLLLLLLEYGIRYLLRRLRVL